MKRALDFLREHNEVALATVGGGGTPLPRLRKWVGEPSLDPS